MTDLEVQGDADSESEVESRAPGPEPRRSALREEWSTIRPSLVFLPLWLGLSALVNFRYPEDEPPFWYFMPAFDVTAILVVYAVFGALRRRVPLALHVAFVALIVIVRLIRLLDALGQQELSRPFNAYIDVPMFPELVRLGYWTLSGWQFALVLVGLPLGIAAIAFVAHHGLRLCERYLADRGHARFFGLLVAVLTVTSLLKPRREELYFGTFGASGLPRLWAEIDFMVHVSGYRASTLEAIARVEREIARTPHDLAGLGGADVSLFFVESYGETVIDRPDFRPEMLKLYREIETDLGRHGFSVASSLITSPAYGGGSWLAHATMATGVRTGDQFQHDLVVAKKPKTMERFFREAGYRTILVEPATTRELAGRQLNEFEEKYYFRHLGYRGPRFGWSTMPDQYVLDFLRKKAFWAGDRPVFLQCVLISSHAPWATQPRMVQDWDAIGDGSIWNRLRPVRFDVRWSNMEQGGPAYMRSIGYDLDALRAYLVKFVKDGSLVVILGDHQPIAEITRDSPDSGVPVHVVSRSKPLVDVFVRRGYTPGMLPQHTDKVRPMETFLIDLLRDFSTPPAAR